jgi:hypothetical protein
MPLSPTPPNGRSGTARCSTAWLSVTPPAEVFATTWSSTSSSLAERVQRQRLLAVVDEPDRLVDVADREHRQDRAEDLVVHHAASGLTPGEHRRSEIPAVAVAVAPDDRGVVTARVEQRRQSIVVTLVDDPCVVG